MKRCNLADDGTVNAYYGDVGYVEDGSNGQVMVEIPKFYYRFVPVTLHEQIPFGETDTGIFGYHIRKGWWFVSPHKHIGFKTHPLFFDTNGQEIDKAYISAYEGSIYDVSESAYLQNDEQIADFTVTTCDKLSSIAGVYPCSGLTQNLTLPNARIIAQNRGTGWQQLTIKAVSAIQLLFIIEYACFDTQSIFGYGITLVTDNPSYNCASLTGSTSPLGNASGRASSTVDWQGIAQTTDGRLAVSYRGIENFYGNMWKFIDGINVWGDGTMDAGTTYICSDLNFESDKKTNNYVNCGFTAAINASTYINRFGYGGKAFDWLFLPSRVSNLNIRVGDIMYVRANIDDYKIVYMFGRWSTSMAAGGFCIDYTSPSNYKSRAVGVRLTYIPSAS
jgi:hypothetical protein